MLGESLLRWSGLTTSTRLRHRLEVQYRFVSNTFPCKNTNFICDFARTIEPIPQRFASFSS